MPPGHPALAVVPLAPGTARRAGPFLVRAVPLVHPVPCAAYLISSGADLYLHLGDTGPSDAVWREVRPAFRAARLHALAVEVSFPSASAAAARANGHLTPALLLAELAKLATPGHAVRDPDHLDQRAALAVARTLAPHFAACPILAIHIKALAYDAVVEELRRYQAAGLDIVIPRQAARYDF